jgi:hypothetical protein
MGHPMEATGGVTIRFKGVGRQGEPTGSAADGKKHPVPAQEKGDGAREFYFYW